MKLDHFVVNIDKKYQKDKEVVECIRNANFPYEPKWGKGTKGFKVSNLWIGNEYLEMVRILKENGGGWVSEWTKRYHQGHRGMICLMLDVEDMDGLCSLLKSRGIPVSKPGWLEFRWFLGLLTRRMPWRNCYVPFFENVPFQIGFQEMKDDKSREFMQGYMVPNARDMGINGIYHAVVKGPYTEKDFEMIKKIFGEKAYQTSFGIQVKLSENQSIDFVKGVSYEVELFTNTDKEKFIEIENIKIHS